MTVERGRGGPDTTSACWLINKMTSVAVPHFFSVAFLAFAHPVKASPFQRTSDFYTSRTFSPKTMDPSGSISLSLSLSFTFSLCLFLSKNAGKNDGQIEIKS